MKKIRYAFIAIAVFAGFFLLQAVVSALFIIVDTVIIYSGSPGISIDAVNKEVMDMVLSQSNFMTLLSDVLAIVICFFVFSYPNKKFFNEVGIYKTNVLYIPVMLLLGISIYIVISVILTILPIPDSWWESYENSISSIDSTLSIMSVISTAIVAPIAEEIIFRGLVFARLSKSFGVTIGMILSAVIFGVAHGNLLWACYAGIIGLAFAFIFYKTKSLICSICVHIAFNATGLIVEDINEYAIVLGFVALGLTIALTYIITVKTQKNK